MGSANAELVLVGQPLGRFVKALESAYTPERFDQMLLVHLSKQRSLYTLANDQTTRFFDVIDAASKQGWAAALVSASLAANPDNPKLAGFVRELGLDPIPDDDSRLRLQKVITEQSQFHDADPFLMEFSRRVDCVCQVIVPGGGGTGFLVAPDLVITNHHVIAPVLNQTVVANRVSCLFDFKMLKDRRQLSAGRSVALHADWHVASRPHSLQDTLREGTEPESTALDYAVLRLAEPVGEEALGPKGAEDVRSAKRGWITVSSDAFTVKENDPLIVIQHPLLPGKRTQEPVQLAMGSIVSLPYDTLRVRHTARTLGGSSGSPCFNADLDLIALHHAGDAITDWQPNPRWNQAIPVYRIVADLVQRALGPAFWDVPAPARAT